MFGVPMHSRSSGAQLDKLASSTIASSGASVWCLVVVDSVVELVVRCRPDEVRSVPRRPLYVQSSA